MDHLIPALILFVLTASTVMAAQDATSSDVQGVAFWKLLTGLALVGMGLGLGRLLNSTEKLTPRLIVGRAIVSAGLAMGAGGMLALIPNLSIFAICGLAALFSTLGEQFIERFLQGRIPGSGGG